MSSDQLDELTDKIARESHGEVSVLPSDKTLSEQLGFQAGDYGFSVVKPDECEITHIGGFCSYAEAFVAGIKLTLRSCALVLENCGIATRFLPGKLNCTDCFEEKCNMMLGTNPHHKDSLVNYEMNSHFVYGVAVYPLLIVIMNAFNFL